MLDSIARVPGLDQEWNRKLEVDYKLLLGWREMRSCRSLLDRSCKSANFELAVGSWVGLVVGIEVLDPVPKILQTEVLQTAGRNGNNHFAWGIAYAHLHSVESELGVSADHIVPPNRSYAQQMTVSAMLCRYCMMCSETRTTDGLSIGKDMLQMVHSAWRNSLLAAQGSQLSAGNSHSVQVCLDGIPVCVWMLQTSWSPS